MDDLAILGAPDYANSVIEIYLAGQKIEGLKTLEYKCKTPPPIPRPICYSGTITFSAAEIKALKKAIGKMKRSRLPRKQKKRMKKAFRQFFQSYAKRYVYFDPAHGTDYSVVATWSR